MRVAKRYILTPTVLLFLLFIGTAGYFAYHKLTNYFQEAQKVTSSTLTTLIQHNWNGQALAVNSTPAFAHWLSSADANEFLTKLKTFQSEKMFRYISTENSAYTGGNVTTFAISSLIELHNGPHVVSARYIYSNNAYRLDDFYLSEKTMPALTDEIEKFIQDMFIDFNKNHWDAAVWQKYSTPELSNIMTQMDFMNKIIAKLKDGAAPPDKITLGDIYVDHGTPVVDVYLSQQIGNMELKLKKINHEWKVAAWSVHN